MIFSSTHNPLKQKLLRRIASVIFATVLTVTVCGPFVQTAKAEVAPAVKTSLEKAATAANNAKALGDQAKAEAARPGANSASLAPFTQKAKAAADEAIAAVSEANRLAAALPSSDANKADSQAAVIAAQSGAGGQARVIKEDMDVLTINQTAGDRAAQEALQAQQAAASRAAVQTNNSGNVTGNGGSTGGDRNKTTATHPLQLCGLGVTGNSSISMCIAGIFYVFFVDLTSPIAYLSGAVFDSFAGLSLQSGTYASAVIAKGWVIARDVSNMAFVFILIYLAIMMILNLESVGAARQIATVIAVALLINFSFFFSRVIIDGSNILAHAFYDNIVAAPAPSSQSFFVAGTKLVGNAVAGVSDTNADIKSISEKVMAGVNPQDLIGNPTFQAMITGPSTGLVGNLAILITLFFIFGVINIILAFVFFTAAFQFLTRIIALWFAIILSPLAFISFILPPAKKIWGQWLGLIINNAFYAPAFMFVIYITIKMLDNGLLSNDISSFLAGTAATSGITAFLNRIVGVVMRLSIVVGLLIAALKVGSYMGAQGASAAQKWAGKIAVGGNAAAVGWAARNTAGWAGNVLARSDTVRNLASGAYGGNAVLKNVGIAVGKTARVGGNKLATSSFDVRSSGVPLMDEGGKAQSGGYVKAIDERSKAIAHEEHDLHDRPEEKANREKRIKGLLEPAETELKAAQAAAAQAERNYETQLGQSRMANEYGTPEDKAAVAAIAQTAKEQKVIAEGKVGESNAHLEALKTEVVRQQGPSGDDRKKAFVSQYSDPGINNLWGLRSNSSTRAVKKMLEEKSDKDKIWEMVEKTAATKAKEAAAHGGGDGHGAPAKKPAAAAPTKKDDDHGHGGGGGGHH